MKRHGNLYPAIVDFSNLLWAAERAQRGKRYRDDILAFNYCLEKNLIELGKELADKTYRPGKYKTFVIFEPKRRLISAAPYRDRVVHHALCNVIAPIFERTMIDTCYANRVGLGTHKALRRFIKLASQYRYVLRADIEKYFPSVDHEILKHKIRLKIKCPDTLWLIETILDGSNEQEPVFQYFAGDDLLTACERRHGMPIGNLTSQLWANVFLNELDHTVAECYGGRRYLRYVDDFAFFSDSRDELNECRERMAGELDAIRLRLHPVKTQITEVKDGVNFLGFRVLPDRVRVRSENLKRGRRRLRHLAEDYRNGQIRLSDIKQSLQSWAAHLAHGDTWRLREKLFGSLALARD